MKSGISSICHVLNDGPQTEKWDGSIFGPAPPTGINQWLRLSSGHSIVNGLTTAQ